MLRNIEKILIVMVVFCISVSTLAQGIPPPPTKTRYYSKYNNQGNMDLYLAYPSIGQREPFTYISGNKKPSSNGNINFVIPVNGSIFFNPTFSDIDYYQSIVIATGEAGNVSVKSNDSSYNISVLGHPLSPASSTRTYNNVGSLGFMANFNGLASNEYPIAFKVEDLGPSPTGQYVEGSILDENPVDLSVDVWALDLDEQSRTIYLKPNQVFPISLKITPEGFPHENICYIIASWGMYTPGLALASNLYLDQACTTTITGDTANSCEKTWQIGGDAPKTIYYKKPATGGNSINLMIRVKDGTTSSNMVTKNLSFANSDNFYPQKLDKSFRILKDYLNSEIKSYRTNLWVDRSNPADGQAFEEHPYQNSDDTEDQNRPFIFIKNQPMSFDNLSILSDQGVSLIGSPYISGTGTYGINFNNISFIENTNNGKTTLDATNISSTTNLANQVDILDMSITWKVNYGTNQSKTLNSMKSKIYVTYNTPTESVCPFAEYGCTLLHPSGLYESILNISCSAAKGKNTEQAIFDAIWNKVRGCNLQTLDGRTLKYYGAGNNTNPNEHNATIQILRDGDGKCGNWATFFSDLLKSQGISQNNQQSFALNLPYIYEDTNGYFKYYLYQNTNKFQGGGNPHAAFFQDHVVNKYNNYIYDTTGNFDKKNNIDDYLSSYIIIRKHYVELDQSGNLIAIYTNPAEEIKLNSSNISTYIRKF